MARWVILLAALWTLVIEPTFGINEMFESAREAEQSAPADRSERNWDACFDQAIPQRDAQATVAKVMQPCPPIAETLPVDWTVTARYAGIATVSPPPTRCVPYPPSDLPLRL